MQADIVKIKRYLTYHIRCELGKTSRAKSKVSKREAINEKTKGEKESDPDRQNGIREDSQDLERTQKHGLVLCHCRIKNSAQMATRVALRKGPEWTHMAMAFSIHRGFLVQAEYIHYHLRSRHTDSALFRDIREFPFLARSSCVPTSDLPRRQGFVVFHYLCLYRYP